MLKALLTILTKLAEAKLEKAGVETLVLNNQNHITEAKQIWLMVDENFRISQTVEDKLKSKVDAFNKALLAKFPELTQGDIDNLRQSVAGEVNQGKVAVLDNSTILQQLQANNTNLVTENASLKDQLSKVKSLIAIAANTTQATETPTDNTSNTTQATDNNQPVATPTSNAINVTNVTQSVLQA